MNITSNRSGRRLIQIKPCRIRGNQTEHASDDQSTTLSEIMRIQSNRVGDYCTRKVAVVSRETTIERCAKLMHDEHVGTVVVVTEKKKLKIPVGIVTDRDIVIEVVAFGIDAATLTAGDLMSGDLATVSEDTDLMAVLSSMREHGVRRLPVVDTNGALAGIVSADDLMGLMATEMDGLVSLIRAEQTRERVTRTSKQTENS